MEAPGERFRGGGGVRRDKRPGGARPPRRSPRPPARSGLPLRKRADICGEARPGSERCGFNRRDPRCPAGGCGVRNSLAAATLPGGRRCRWRGARGAHGPVHPPLVSPRRRPARPGRKPRRCCVTHPGQGGSGTGAAAMPDYLGADQRKTKEEEKEDKPIRGERRCGRGPGPAVSPGPAGRYHGTGRWNRQLPFPLPPPPAPGLGPPCSWRGNSPSSAPAAMPAAISVPGAAGLKERGWRRKAREVPRRGLLALPSPTPPPPARSPGSAGAASAALTGKRGWVGVKRKHRSGFKRF